MQVRLLTDLAGPGGHASAGQVLDEEAAVRLGVRLADLVPRYAAVVGEEPVAEVAAVAPAEETAEVKPGVVRRRRWSR
jgi:hypothetical protein